MGRCLEQQHRYDAQYIQQIVDAGDVNLSLVGRRVLEFHGRPEVQMDGFAEYCKASADESLTGNDGRCGGHDDAWYKKPLGHNGVKGVCCGVDILRVGNDVCSLPHVIDDEHGLDEYPAHGNVAASTVAEVGVKGFGTGGTQEYGAQNKKPFRTCKQQIDGIIRIEGLDDKRETRHACDAKHAEHGKPRQHKRSENAAY